MLRSFAIAGILLASLTAPALAETATTSGGLFVNIRTGPGTAHPVIRRAWPGVQFNVTNCAGNWCAVQYRNTTGYMSSRHLDINE